MSTQGTAARSHSSRLLESALGQPVRVTFFAAGSEQRHALAHGLLERVVDGKEIRITCTERLAGIEVGDRAVVEVLFEGALLLLFAELQAQPRSDQLCVTWPGEVQTQQRRRHPRVDVRLPVHFLRPTEASPQRGEIENLSAGGMAVVTTTPLNVGESLFLAFGPGSGHFFQKVEANVVRVTPVVGAELHYRVGLQFTGLESEAEVMLSEWIRSQRRKDGLYEGDAEHL